MSKGKGSSPAGSTTASTINPTQMAQYPHLTTAWDQADYIYNNAYQHYYPDKTLADFRPENALYPAGYNALNAAGQNLQNTLQPIANQAWQTAATGGYGVQNSPAYGGYQQYAGGTAEPQNAFRGIGNTALGFAGGGGPGMEQLARSASGYYLNNQNPYLQDAYNAAVRPITENYQRSVAPTLDAQFSQGGRYGSPSLGSATQTQQEGLGRTLDDYASRIYDANYQRERAAQDAAAGNYQTLAFRGLDAASEAARQQAASQQYGLTGLASGYNAGNLAAANALTQYPQLAGAQFLAPRAQIEAGKGLTDIDQTYRTYEQQLIDASMKRYYGQAAEPWENLKAYESVIGAPLTGTSATSTPYFQNQTANALSGITGGLGIANQLGGLGGLGGLFGSGAGGAATAASLFPGAAASSLPAYMAANTAIDFAAPAAAAALTIVCTELVEQRRMPNKWRLAGMKTFLSYPDIGKRGYNVLAVPTVRQLRRRPYSLYSRIVAKAFNWRAEDIAARAGVKGARRLLRGRMVTAALVLPCLLLGAFCRRREWRIPYREQSI